MDDPIYVVVSEQNDPIYVVVSGQVAPPIAVAVATPGPPGPPAYTTTTADFEQPAIGASVSVAVLDTSWMPNGAPLFIEGGGTYKITAIPNATHVTVLNLGATDNALEGTVISSGAKIALGGGAFVGVSFAQVVGLIEALA